MDHTGLPVSQAQCEWFYRRSGTITNAKAMLNSGWFEPGVKQYLAPNLVAEAAKDFGVSDDRARLAIARAALVHGRKVGQWDEAVAAAAAATGLAAADLRKRAESSEVLERGRISTAEFCALKADQRPAFLITNKIGDRAVFSGVVALKPLEATLDAMLHDASAYESYAAHHGAPPAS
jgi:predicted DsbA family dithiol-disulfide isomerase